MADLESLHLARRLLDDLVERAPSLTRRLADGSSPAKSSEMGDLLERRLERASAENREAVALGLPSTSESERRAEVVQQILHGDLVGDPTSSPGGQMISECHELILSQREVDAEPRKHGVQRRYVIRDGGGRELGELQQLADPADAGVAGLSILELSDLRLHAIDRTTGQTLAFERAGDQLYLLDEVHRQLGFVHVKTDAGPTSFKVISCIDRGMFHVKAVPETPYLLRIVGNIGEEIGVIERRYVGLPPFWERGNQVRIRVGERRLSPGQRWGLIATALLAGVGDEQLAQDSSGS